MLLERRELTAGSTWHAAGGMHTLNGDPNVARLQQYTIQLYEEIQRVSGQDCSIHLPGGLMLADTEVRMDWLRMAQARGRYLGMDLELITRQGSRRTSSRCSTRSTSSGALYDPVEGHVDPTGVTRAYVKCAQLAGRRGPPAHAGRRPVAAAGRHVGRPRRERRLDPHRARRQRRRPVGARGRPDGRHRAAGPGHGAHVPADRGHARGRRPTSPGPAARCRWRSTSPARSTSARKAARCCSAPTSRRACRGRRARRRGTSGRSCSSRTSTGSRPSCRVAFKHYPAMGTIGIKRVVNGPFTFSPDGNPLVGPVRGLRGYWVACGVMAGLSQGGGVGPGAGDLDDRRRPRRQRHGYLGDGRRPLRRLRHARVHERQGPGELPPPLPDHVPERGAAGRAPAAHDADLRPADRRERGLGRDLRPGARAVVPAAGPRAEGGGHLPALERLGVRGRGGRGRPRAGRDDRDLELRQVPGHGSRAPRRGCRRCSRRGCRRRGGSR